MKHLHFVGIGGIGMSGLASWCRSLNIKVTGSDRDSGKAENNHILAPLRAQGIEIFPQDGSFINAGKPDFLIYSSAIEADNPDFIAAGNIERLHRSRLLDLLLKKLDDRAPVAIAGSCGSPAQRTWTKPTRTTFSTSGAAPSAWRWAVWWRFCPAASCS